MKKRIQKCIDGSDYVKVHINAKKGDYITHVDGIILAQSADLILMSDSFDFHYDGLVVVRKVDISEIQLTDNERFMKRLLIAEGYMTLVKKRHKQLGLKLGSLQEVLEQLKRSKLPIIIECKYWKSDLFQIGPILDVTDKRLTIDHFNPRGEFDVKAAVTKLKDITLVRIDSPYANTFYKYAKRVQ